MRTIRQPGFRLHDSFRQPGLGRTRLCQRHMHKWQVVDEGLPDADDHDDPSSPYCVRSRDDAAFNAGALKNGTRSRVLVVSDELADLCRGLLG